MCFLAASIFLIAKGAIIEERHLVKVDGLAGHLPSAGGMSGLRVADWKCGSQTDDGTKKSVGFFLFEKAKLS